MPTELTFDRVFKSLTKSLTTWSVGRCACVVATITAPIAPPVRARFAIPSPLPLYAWPIMQGLALVAIVVGGCMFAFGRGDSTRILASIVFSVGMAISALNFIMPLFGGQ